MVLLRRVIGDALRARRQGQQRTLREVSTAANVSLGYLSEIERGQKEASSELLAAICAALGARLSEVLREVSDTVALAEQLPAVLVPVRDDPDAAAATLPAPAPPVQQHPTADPAPLAPRAATGTSVGRVSGPSVRKAATHGKVPVSVRPDSPLRATLTTTHRLRAAERDVVCAA